MTMEPYKAKVLWWDSHTIAVLCPLCWEVEKHDYVVSPTNDGWYALNALCCSSNVACEAVFPREAGPSKRKTLTKKTYETVSSEMLKLNELRAEPSNERATPIAISASITASLDEGLQKQLHEVRSGGHPRELERSNMRVVLPSLMHTPRFSPQISLGGVSRRRGNNIEILARSPTINGIQLTSCLAKIKVTRGNRRTVAVLHQGIATEIVIAVSGWKQITNSAPNSKLINSQEWTEKVRKFCEDDIDYFLRFENWDRDHLGQYSACHAEKQVMVYFVKTNNIPRRDVGEAGMGKYEGLQEAFIALDSSPCEDCQQFKKKTEALYKVTFHFVRMEENFRKKSLKGGIPRTPSRTSPGNIHPTPKTVTPPDSGSTRKKSYNCSGCDKAYRGLSGLWHHQTKSKTFCNPNHRLRASQRASLDKQEPPYQGDPESPSFRRNLRSQKRHELGNPPLLSLNRRNPLGARMSRYSTTPTPGPSSRLTPSRLSSESNSPQSLSLSQQRELRRHAEWELEEDHYTAATYDRENVTPTSHIELIDLTAEGDDMSEDDGSSYTSEGSSFTSESS